MLIPTGWKLSDSSSRKSDLAELLHSATRAVAGTGFDSFSPAHVTGYLAGLTIYVVTPAVTPFRARCYALAPKALTRPTAVRLLLGSV
jgi:hypothetical protein